MTLKEVINRMQSRIDNEHKVFTRADSMYRKGYLHAIRDLKSLTKPQTNTEQKDDH